MQIRFTKAPRAARGQDAVTWTEALSVCQEVAHRYSSCPHVAAEAAQEAVIRAWRAPARDDEIRDPRAWLATIARHEVFRLTGRRVRQHEGPLEERHEPSAVDERLKQVERRVDVSAALATLPLFETEPCSTCGTSKT